MSDIVIQVENLSKRYTLGKSPNSQYGSFRDMLAGQAKQLTRGWGDRAALNPIRLFGRLMMFLLIFAKGNGLVSLVVMVPVNRRCSKC